MKNIFVKVAIYIATSLLTAVSANAQVTIGSNTPPSKYSLLDLKEDATGNSTKGFHMPRMTHSQRDALLIGASAADSIAAKGLLIYNSEDDCKHFFNGKEWITLCQGTSNPKVDIPASACNKIKLYGQYYKNSPLNSSHYIILPITVTQKGNYTIIANSNNGYYFQTSGMLDEVGTFELKLDGMGTPAQNRTDNLVITCNGIVIGSSCTVNVQVGSLTMGYQTDCDGIKVFGLYQTRKFMNASDNYVKVPIDVLVDGQTSVETNQVNNIKFVCNQTLGSLGQDTLILTAQGSPKQAGKFTYTFTTTGSIKTTCSFEVEVTSTLGTFDDPACKCLDIYDENPMADDGEYYLQDCISPTYNTDNSMQVIKTYCDIKNGGWTLVWSYSELTARNNYATTGSMTVNGGGGNGTGHSANLDTPHNRVTNRNDNINYNNYRLLKTEWQHFPNSTQRPQLKARITVNPTDMKDEWALNNYIIMSPRNTNENPLETAFNDYRLRVPVEGKIFGKNFKVDPSISANYGGWDEMSGNRGELVVYSGNSYCTHWNFAHLGSSTGFQVVPNPGNMSGNNNSIAMTDIDNSFGWFGETQPNHHFGKCGGANGDDYSFGTKQCAGSSLYPHNTINSGQGRIMQWFVR